MRVEQLEARSLNLHGNEDDLCLNTMATQPSPYQRTLSQVSPEDVDSGVEGQPARNEDSVR